MEIGNRIREARTRKSMSQNQLAELLGISQSLVAAYENGRKVPKIETIERIAAALGISVLTLLPSDLTNGAVTFTTPEEKEVFEIMTDLNETGQKKVLDYATDIRINPDYRK